VTLGRIFSCFHDRDHVHPHIHANFHTESYTKHAIHPPNINTPKSKIDFSSFNLAKGEGSLKKKYMLKKHRKIYAPIKEQKKEKSEA
jgi:hypothetical protein